MKTRVMLSQSFIYSFYNGINLRGQSIHIKKDDGLMSDYEALRKDWENVGADIKKAAKEYSGN